MANSRQAEVDVLLWHLLASLSVPSSCVLISSRSLFSCTNIFRLIYERELKKFLYIYFVSDYSPREAVPCRGKVQGCYSKWNWVSVLAPPIAFDRNGVWTETTEPQIMHHQRRTLRPWEGNYFWVENTFQISQILPFNHLILFDKKIRTLYKVLSQKRNHIPPFYVC